MRNAAATFDDDFGSSRAPRKGARARSAGGTGKKKKGGRRAVFDMNGVARYAAIGMAATMALGIMVNALVLQKGHHPAPLFGKAAAASPAPAAAPKAVVAAIPAVHATAPNEAPAVDNASARSHRVVGGTHADASAGGDAIGRLLAGEDPIPGKARATLAKASPAKSALTMSALAKSASAKSGSNKPTAEKGDAKAKIVSGAQRALTKLGFTVPATGTNGPATRKAIEAFQKDHHLPVKGELDGKMVKLLAAESGVKID